MDGKRHIITIAAIGPDSGQTLTLGVYDALRQADALLLRTGRHGVADRLRQEGVAFETLDALYDRTEDFDELCELAARAIIDRARQAQTLIYAVSEPQSDATVRALVQALTEGVDSLLERARIFYDFITLNMKYTFMPAYFILENIAEAAARSYTGDCGVFALLFVTLCRCAGIPAQWQSGLTAEPDFCGGHDWARFYIAPYGWLYADPSYGIAAVRARNETRRRFYFGNLDAYRMVANNAFQAPFTVPKQHWRADPYDNQVGEIETAERGLGYGEFERSKEVLLCEELPL